MTTQPRDDRSSKVNVAVPPNNGRTPLPHNHNGQAPAPPPQTETERVAHALAAPFAPDEVRFRPGPISGNQALAFPYINVRAVMDRLDEVVGLDGWQDKYTVLPDGSVMCQLQVRFGDTWIAKVDVGSRSEQPDEGDRDKAAFSDALKRVAVKFGVGRYLHRIPAQWVEWDAPKRRFGKRPLLPAWAMPAAQPSR
jgi:hypothetical protein